MQILEKIAVESGYDVNAYEKLSIWTLISLTHDLGYPLQKQWRSLKGQKHDVFFRQQPYGNNGLILQWCTKFHERFCPPFYRFKNVGNRS